MRFTLLLSALLATSVNAGPDPINVENTEKLTATVESIDLGKRLVTLKGPNGRTETVEVAPDVKNLAQVKAGDKVVVRYYEGLAAQLRKKGEPASTAEAAALAATAPAGQKPAGMVGGTVNGTVVIESVDKKANTVTFRTKEDGVHTVAVEKPEARKFIAGLKKGDEVDITFTQALAVSVEPAN